MGQRISSVGQEYNSIIWYILSIYLLFWDVPLGQGISGLIFGDNFFIRYHIKMEILYGDILYQQMGQDISRPRISYVP